MKHLISIQIFLSLFLIYSSDENVDINFIIMVDDELSVGTIANPHFVILNNDGSEEKVDFFYEPGLLRLANSDLEKINSEQVKSLRMKIDHYELGAVETGAYQFELEFDKRWLKQRYTILKIYNLEKKKYRRMFFPLEGRNYTFEVRTPDSGISITRIQKG